MTGPLEQTTDDPVTRFLILGVGRSGSNMLKSMLEAHPDVRCHGELFSNDHDREFHWDSDRRVAPGEAALRASDPERFLRDEVFQVAKSGPGTGSGGRAVGFKLFYHHARDARFEAVRRAVVADESIRVLHLTRRNLLAQVVSRMIADRTGRWSESTVRGEAERPDGPRIRIEPRDCLEQFHWILEWEAEARLEFAAHPVLELEYESLRDMRQRESDRVLDHLGVSRVEIAPSTRRQRRRPLASVIENYDELRAAAHGTPWQRFFVHD